MSESEESLRNLINASGFPFQLRVEHEIRALVDRHERSYRIIREHRWVESPSSTEGFIDLVVIDGNSRIAIECKRVQNGHWVFLNAGSRIHMARARLMWTHRQKNLNDMAGWDDFHVAPSSPESAFCVVRGQSDRDSPMLERLSGILLRSMEQLADEELALGVPSVSGRAHIYHPMIVTNATLHVCNFSSSDIDPLAGELSTGQFEQVPFIRFRKNLSTSGSYQKIPSDLEASNTEHERTVFVANISALPSILREWETTPFDRFVSWPWVLPREQEGRME